MFLLIAYVRNKNTLINAETILLAEKIILKSAVDEQVTAFLLNVDKEAEVGLVRQNVLNYLIEQEVLFFFAEKDSLLRVEEAQIKQVVEERLSFFKSQLGSVSALESYFGVDYLESK